MVIRVIALVNPAEDTWSRHNARGPSLRGIELNGEQARNESALLVVVVLCLGLGGLLTGDFCFDIYKQIQQRTILRQEGRDAVGKVTATHAGHGPSTVTYAFKVNEGDYSGKAEMPDYRLILHDSDRIVVRYLPTDPGVNHPADWEWSGLEIMDLIPELFILCFTLVGVKALIALFRNRKLARDE